MKTNHFVYNIKRITYLAVLAAVMIPAAAGAVPPPLAVLSKGSVTIVSGDTTGNGVIENNQQGVFKLSLINSAYSLDNVFDVSAALTTYNPDINIIDGSSTYGNMNVGVTRSPTDNGFTFNVLNNFSGNIEFEINISYEDGEDVAYTLNEPLVLTMPVERINHAPVLNSIGNKSVNEGVLLEFTVSAADIDGDSLNYSAYNLPPGAIFNSSTHTFSWTPAYNQSGTYPGVRFEVTDGALSDSEDITITVNDVPDQLGDKVVVLSASEAAPGDSNTVSLTIMVQDINGAPKAQHSDYIADIVLSSATASATPGRITIPNGTTSTTVNINDPKAEMVTVMLSEVSSTPLLEIPGSATFIHGIPEIVEMSIDNCRPTANGVDTTPIIVYIFDKDYDPIAGEPVTVLIVSGCGSITPVIDMGYGRYETTYTTGTVAEIVPIKARDENRPDVVTVTLEIELRPGPIVKFRIEDQEGQEIGDRTMSLGETLELWTVARDQFDNPVELGGIIYWDVSGGIGLLDNITGDSNIFHADNIGTGIISAGDGGDLYVAYTGTINVTGGVVITIDSQPTGREVIVDSTSHIAPYSFAVEPGQTFTLDTPSPQTAGANMRYIFDHWSNSGPQSQTIVAPGNNTTYTAYFTTEYETSLTGDLNEDGEVDLFDLVIVTGHFGGKSAAYVNENGGTQAEIDIYNQDLRADVNQDGIIDLFDLVLVTGHFGERLE